MKRDRSGWLAAGDLSTIGLTLVLAIVIGYFGGRWIGEKFGNGEIGSIVGFLFGVFAGFHQMFRTVSRWNRIAESEDQSDQVRNDNDNDN